MEDVKVPVIGGHSGITILPLLSQVMYLACAPVMHVHVLSLSNLAQ